MFICLKMRIFILINMPFYTKESAAEFYADYKPIDKILKNVPIKINFKNNFCIQAFSYINLHCCGAGAAAGAGASAGEVPEPVPQ